MAHIRFLRPYAHHRKGDEMPNWHDGSARMLVDRHVAEYVETTAKKPRTTKRTTATKKTTT